MSAGMSNVCVRYAVRESDVDRHEMITDHIVIGTPGTVRSWCFRLKIVDPLKIKVFVLDEADVMLAQQGHGDESIRVRR